jgi:hypothetical protein
METKDKITFAAVPAHCVVPRDQPIVLSCRITLKKQHTTHSSSEKKDTSDMNIDAIAKQIATTTAIIEGVSYPTIYSHHENVVVDGDKVSFNLFMKLRSGL